MKKLILLTCVVSFGANASLCSNDGYVVGFFNGVWNSKNDAKLSAFAFQKHFGNEYNSEPVAYEVFYNVTGSEVGATQFQDIAEVFIQRAEEIDPSLENRFDIFSSAITGDSDGFLSKVKQIVVAPVGLVTGLLEDLYDWAMSETAALLSDLFFNPPTVSDYAKHNMRVKTLGTQGAKMLFIAHSQGNLFANNAYNAAIELENVDESNIGLIHIAPASTELNGPYTLANLDLIINGLRVLGPVPDTNVDIPASHLKVDASGHMLIPTYLNTDLDTSHKIFKDIKHQFESLKSPQSVATKGAFTATLSWDGAGDVDLHVFEPNGSHVYYDNPQGIVGELDVDNKVGDGPEHYFASCDETVFEEGLYQVALNNYAEAEGSTATVQVSTSTESDLMTKELIVGPEQGRKGNSNPEYLIDVVVTKDETGKFKISAK